MLSGHVTIKTLCGRRVPLPAQTHLTCLPFGLALGGGGKAATGGLGQAGTLTGRSTGSGSWVGKQPVGAVSVKCPFLPPGQRAADSQPPAASGGRYGCRTDADAAPTYDTPHVAWGSCYTSSQLDLWWCLVRGSTLAATCPDTLEAATATCLQGVPASRAPTNSFHPPSYPDGALPCTISTLAGSDTQLPPIPGRGRWSPL